jgi:hypothetical protein
LNVFNRPPVRRNRQGVYVVTLGPDERAVLRSLPAQMREVLTDPDDPGLRRLFPPAYSAPEDRELQEEFRRLMNEDLLARHEEALGVLEETAGAEELTPEQLDGWLRALNSIRLLLGTRLDVSEDDDLGVAMTPERALYHFLGYLQESVVEALSGEG